jgi:23S rRNA (cytidine1920-2'-O)/16S rRNA (cytidine1409-2'-O)-methyltransferase
MRSPKAAPGDDHQQWASRGALKLLAGLKTFRLLGRIRGARAIDIGASTGGFTDVLLYYGARHVTCVEVGYDQMVERLRNDARVLLLERVNFKTVSLQVAAGPFDFFVADVSFMAARTLLKPLRHRINVGTEGIVLVKPQFELPDALIPKGGVIVSKNLRKLAFNRFKRKAVQLGYEIVQRIDCPIAGGDGNVEYLVHLRYTGVVPAAREEGADDRDVANSAEAEMDAED